MAVPNSVFRPFIEKLGDTDVSQFVGNEGEIFYDPESGGLLRSDGETPGGVPFGTPGQITDIVAGNGIDGGGNTGQVTLSLSNGFQITGIITSAGLESTDGDILLVNGDITLTNGGIVVSSGNISATSGAFIGDGSQLTGVTAQIPDYLDVDGATISGVTTYSNGTTPNIDGNLIPVNAGQTLGTVDNPWVEAFFSNNSVYIGLASITSTDEGIVSLGQTVMVGSVMISDHDDGGGANISTVFAETLHTNRIEGLTIDNTISLGSSIYPESNVDIGSSTSPLNALWVSPNSLHVGIATINEAGGMIAFGDAIMVGATTVRYDADQDNLVLGPKVTMGDEEVIITPDTINIKSIVVKNEVLTQDLTVGPPGSISAGGSITGATIFGDGSGLTNITAEVPEDLTVTNLTVTGVTTCNGEVNIPENLNIRSIEGVSAGSTISIGTSVGFTDDIVIGASGGTGNTLTINSDLLESNTAATFNNVTVVAGFYGNSFYASSGGLTLASSGPNEELELAGGVSITGASGITSIPGGTISLSAGDSADSAGDDEFEGGAGQVNITSGNGAGEFNGGDINILAGIGSNAEFSSGGDVTISGGDASATSGNGGSVVVSAGDATVGADAGNVNLLGGDVTSTDRNDVCGDVFIRGGNRTGILTNSTETDTCGDVTIKGGSGSGNKGGPVKIEGGTGFGDGDGGNVEIEGGYVTNQGRTAGEVKISGGLSVGFDNTVGGGVTIAGGDIRGINPAPGSVAGDVYIRGGAGEQAVIAGSVILKGGEGPDVTSVGAVAMQGGTAFTGNDAGGAFIRGGLNLSDANSGSGGQVRIEGGNRLGTDSNIVNGGNISILGGTREGAGVNSVRGGTINIVGGEGTGSAAGGNVEVRGGTGEEGCGKLTLAGGNGGFSGNASPGGDCEIFGGLSGGDNQEAGHALVQGGSAVGNDSVAGDLILHGGDVIAGTSTCGNVLINGGDRSGATNIEGHVTLQNIYRFEPLSGVSTPQEIKYFFEGTLANGVTDTITVGDQASLGTLKVEFQASRATGTPSGRTLGQTLIAHYGTDIQTQLQGAVNSTGSLPTLVTVSGVISSNDLQLTVKNEVTEDVNYKLFVTAYSIN